MDWAGDGECKFVIFFPLNLMFLFNSAFGWKDWNIISRSLGSGEVLLKILRGWVCIFFFKWIISREK